MTTTGMRGEMTLPRRGIFTRFLRPTEQAQPKDLEALRHDTNIEAFQQLVRLNKERMEWASHLRRHVDNTFRAIETLSVIAFAMGVVMIIVPFLVFFLSSTRDPNLLWFSGIGFAETFAVLIYKPMRQIQDALSNLIQGIIILHSWVTQVGLILYGMNVEREDHRINATEKISELTSNHVLWLQKYLEGTPAKTSKEEV